MRMDTRPLKLDAVVDHHQLMLATTLERLAAAAMANQVHESTFECEVRIGVRLNRSGRRAMANERAASFNSNVSRRLFFATFQFFG